MVDGSNAGRSPIVSDDVILNLINDKLDMDTHPVLSTTEIAEELPIGRRATLDRLRGLTDAGELCRKNVGNGHALWWQPDVLLRNNIRTKPSNGLEIVARDEIDTSVPRPMVKENAVLPEFDEDSTSENNTIETSTTSDEPTPDKSSSNKDQKEIDSFGPGDT